MIRNVLIISFSHILSSQIKTFNTLFITQEPVLRATQYLPGIAKLQHQLYELYHRKLDLGEANKMTVTEFLENLESGMVFIFIHET